MPNIKATREMSLRPKKFKHLKQRLIQCQKNLILTNLFQFNACLEAKPRAKGGTTSEAHPFLAFVSLQGVNKLPLALQRPKVTPTPQAREQGGYGWKQGLSHSSLPFHSQLDPSKKCLESFNIHEKVLSKQLSVGYSGKEVLRLFHFF